MEQYFGTWKINAAENKGFEEFGRCAGMSAEQVAALNNRDFIMLIEEKAGGSYRLFVDYGTTTEDITFKFGVQQDYTGIDGVKSKLTVSMQGNMLVEDFVQEDGSTWTVRTRPEGKDLLVAKS
ncbi:uncharacterized protein LOC106012122 [Aplysia californica]|uniref:Uncharacterized protein LOC106012122 n=1 Tax=Aplysia californica TaxID=6500 RepID=A0ABM1A2E5_APLCA|nr:uncharacterized protein LOC106012122 [Aplysia californica]